MVAAGANLLPGTNVPGGQLWGGNPAVFMRDLTAVDFAALETVRTLFHVHAYAMNLLLLLILLTSPPFYYRNHLIDALACVMNDNTNIYGITFRTVTLSGGY